MSAFLLTLVLHVTILGLLAALLSATVVRRTASREALWRSALHGGVLSASLQVLFAWGAPLTLPSPVASTPLSAPATFEASTPMPAAPGDAPYVLPTPASLPERAPRGPGLPAPVPGPAVAIDAPPAERTFLRPDLGALLLCLWMGGAYVLGLRGRRARRVLQEALGARTRLDAQHATRIWGRLAPLAARARVRLSIAEHLDSPLALGIRRREVVLPARALDTLGEREREAMLAHELAHHLRRDPLRRRLDGFTACLLFPLPTTWWARRRLVALSELGADERAVALTGDPDALAACLTEVAGWVRPPLGALPVPAMARPRSLLGLRVLRLLDRGRLDGNAPLRRVVAFGAVFGVALLAPGFAGASATGPTLDTRAPGRPLPMAPPAAAADARTTAPSDPTRSPLAVLDGEISLLTRELAALEARVARSTLAQEAAPLLGRIRARLQRLETRRAALMDSPAARAPTVSEMESSR